MRLVVLLRLDHKLTLRHRKKPALIEMSCCSATTGVFRLISVKSQNVRARSVLTATTYQTIRDV